MPTISEVLADRRSVSALFPASIAISIGDLLLWNHGSGYAQKASARTDLATAALNQADFRPLFLGVAGDQRLSTETSTGNASRRRVVLEGVFDCTCVSATFEYGDYVGVARDGTNNVNLNQTVVKVNGPHLAIGRVLQPGTSITTVRCFLSAYEFGYFKGNSGGLQLPGLIAASDANTTLTVDQLANATILTMTPGANPRKLIMPSEARSTGLKLHVQNLAGATNGIQVRDSGDAATIITVPATKAGYVYCDGTTWYGIVGA